jgi:hypothetical protein
VVWCSRFALSSWSLMQIVWPFFLATVLLLFKDLGYFFPNFRSPWFNNRFDVKVKRKSSDVLSHKNFYARNLQFYQFFYSSFTFQVRLGGCSRRHDTQHNGSRDNDIQRNETQHNDTQHNNTQHNGSVVSISVVNAECHLCWVRHINRVSFMLSVTYAECDICWV